MESSEEEKDECDVEKKESERPIFTSVSNPFPFSLVRSSFTDPPSLSQKRRGEELRNISFEPQMRERTGQEKEEKKEESCASASPPCCLPSSCSSRSSLLPRRKKGARKPATPAVESVEPVDVWRASAFPPCLCASVEGGVEGGFYVQIGVKEKGKGEKKVVSKMEEME